MDLDTARQLVGDDVLSPSAPSAPAQPRPVQPRSPSQASPVPRRFPQAPTGNVLGLPERTGDLPTSNAGQSSMIDDYRKRVAQPYENWRAQQSPALQFFLPADTAEAAAMLATGGMGYEGGLGVRGALNLATRWAPRIGLGAAAGGAGAALEGKPMLGGAAKGGFMGAVGEGLQYLQNAAGTARLGRYLTNEVPRRIADVVTRHAPWLPDFESPRQYMRVFQQMRRSDVGAQARLSQLWDQEIGNIDQQLRQNGAQNIVTRWAGNPRITTPAGQPLPVRPPRTFREALDTIKRLGDASFAEGQRVRGYTADDADAIRRQLIDDVETHLARYGLDAPYREARTQYGRGQAFARLFSQEGVIKNGRIDREALQKAWQNLSPRGLDVDARFTPQELDDIERALFGAGDPTLSDVPGRGARLRTALTTRHIPPVYADPPILPLYVGERPLAPWTPPSVSHLAAQRMTSAAMGNIHRQPNIPMQGGQPSDVVTPSERQDIVPAEGGPTEAMLAAVRQQYPHLSDEQIRTWYREYQQQQQQPPAE